MRPAVIIFVLSALPMIGCAPIIGDKCGNSIDCSVNGDRICDNAQPGGYCTIQSCEADTCPDEGVCVRFRPEPSRLAQTWCMRFCEGNSDCRESDGYACVVDAELGNFEVEPGIGLPIAVTLDVDRSNLRYCAATLDL